MIQDPSTYTIDTDFSSNTKEELTEIFSALKNHYDYPYLNLANTVKKEDIYWYTLNSFEKLIEKFTELSKQYPNCESIYLEPDRDSFNGSSLTLLVYSQKTEADLIEDIKEIFSWVEEERKYEIEQYNKLKAKYDNKI